MIVLQTNHGDITIALNHEKAPVTAANFEQYVRDGFYDGTLFHRVIDGFMIQGGGFDQDFNQKPTRDPIENEADNGLQNTIGTLAMARTQDPHSATAQFSSMSVTTASLTIVAKACKAGAMRCSEKSLKAWMW